MTLYLFYLYCSALVSSVSLGV